MQKLDKCMLLSSVIDKKVTGLHLFIQQKEYRGTWAVAASLVCKRSNQSSKDDGQKGKKMHFEGYVACGD